VKQKISATEKLVAKWDGLVMFIETRIAYELSFYNPTDTLANYTVFFSLLALITAGFVTSQGL